jgi:hypothetical protein
MSIPTGNKDDICEAHIILDIENFGDSYGHARHTSLIRNLV